MDAAFSPFGFDARLLDGESGKLRHPLYRKLRKLPHISNTADGFKVSAAVLVKFWIRRRSTVKSDKRFQGFVQQKFHELAD